MTSDAETLAVYARKADAYAEMVSRGEPDADLLAFMKAATPSGHVLDLGCGPGNSAAIMQARGFTVEAIDASPEMVALARDKFGVAAKVASFDDLDETD